MYELHPSEEDAAVAVAGQRRVHRLSAGRSRGERRAAPAGRPDQRAGPGRRRRRAADRGRADRHLRPAAERGPRSHRERHGQRLVGAVPPPRISSRACAASRARASAVEELMRWDTPLQMFERWVLEDVEVRGVADPEGRRAGPAVRLGEPRPRVFDDPDALLWTRARTRTSPSAPGSTSASGAARAAGAPDVVRDGPAPLPALRACRGAARGSRTTSSAGCESCASRA